MKNMTGSTFRRLLPALAFALAAAAPMASHAVDIRPMIKAGFDFGGEEVATTTSGGSLNLNELLYIGGGASILTDSKDIEVEVTLAWKYGNLSASDGSISFTRFPLEALVFYRLPQFRLGGGLTYHLSPKLKGDGVASGLDVKFDNATGFILQADYLINPKMTVGVRYTNLDYKLGGVSADSSGIGFTFGISF
jgi:hypothetical protein